MVSDDVIYGALLFISIPLGLTVRSVPSGRIREIWCCLLGISITLITCRYHALHSVIVTVVNSFIIITASKARYLPVISFVWCFSYLYFFRSCQYYGLPAASPHSNAVQLLLTLRLVGLACEVHNTEKLALRASELSIQTDKHAGPLTVPAEELTEVNLKLKYTQIDYSLWNIISYSYCYIGALTGPFYTCRTYQDMISHEELSSLPLWTDIKQRLRPFPLCALIFLCLTTTISVQNAREDEFYEGSSFTYRYVYVCVLLFTLFRTRFYCAWILAECMCVTAGLGAYPKQGCNKPGGGPSNLKDLDEVWSDADGDVGSEEESIIEYDYMTITNTAPYETEKCTSIRSGIRRWNQTVQWWLAVHVYKNIPVYNTTLRGLILMIISAYWHGVHPGWYATFLSAPLLLLAEDSMRRGVRDRLSGYLPCRIYDYISAFFTMRMFEYYAVGAHFLVYSDIARYWSSIYYIGHIVLVLLIVIGEILCRLAPKAPKAADIHAKRE